MVGFDRGETLADRFRTHAGDQTHLYGYALRSMADDLEVGGPTAAVVRGYEDAPTGAVIQLRLLAGIFRLVLTDRAPALEPYYPCLGGAEPPAQSWPAMREVIADHIEELHDALTVAPQTNDVGRSAALLVGLFDVAAATGCRRIRLLELGASAGLNLLLDRFHITGEGWTWGPPDSPVQLRDAVSGPVAPVDITVTSARGCDLDPVDASSEEGQLRLTSFVWPFDLHRHGRLAGALELAAARPPVVDRASAAAWLAEQLDRPGSSDDEMLRVVWHSVTQLYWPPAEIEAVTAALAAYGDGHRVAEVGMEYDRDGSTGQGPRVWTKVWRGNSPVRHRLLGNAHDHGVPVQIIP